MTGNDAKDRAAGSRLRPNVRRFASGAVIGRLGRKSAKMREKEKGPSGEAAGLLRKGIMRKGKKKEDSCLRTEGKRRRRCKGEWGFDLC